MVSSQIGIPNPDDQFRCQELPDLFDRQNFIWTLGSGIVSATLLSLGHTIAGLVWLLLSCLWILIIIDYYFEARKKRAKIRDQNMNRWIADRSLPFLPEPSEFIGREWLEINEPEAVERMEKAAEKRSTEQRITTHYSAPPNLIGRSRYVEHFRDVKRSLDNSSKYDLCADCDKRIVYGNKYCKKCQRDYIIKDRYFS